MKTYKKLRTSALLALTCLMLSATALQAGARTNKKPTGISALTAKSVTINVGEEKELKVRMTPANAEDDYLQWEIRSGTNCVRFDDTDLSDDSIDLRALKAGTAKVRCYIDIPGKTNKKVDFTVKVKAAPKSASTITAKGKTSRSVYIGDDFELEVKKSSGLKDRYLKWSIADKSIVQFEDYYETTGDDVEFWAKKAGTTKITCTNTKTKKKVTFTVTVKKPTASITREGPKTRMVELGDDFDLEVKKKSRSVKDRNLTWTISDKKIADFENIYETIGGEVEFIAKRTGTVTITCKNKATGESVSFTVNVVPYYDDDYDDD